MYYILDIVAEWMQKNYKFDEVIQVDYVCKIHYIRKIYAYRMCLDDDVFLYVYLDFHNDITIEYVENCIGGTMYHIYDFESPDMFDKLKLAIDHMINDYKLSKRFMARNV